MVPIMTLKVKGQSFFHSLIEELCVFCALSYCDHEGRHTIPWTKNRRTRETRLTISNNNQGCVSENKVIFPPFLFLFLEKDANMLGVSVPSIPLLDKVKYVRIPLTF